MVSPVLYWYMNFFKKRSNIWSCLRCNLVNIEKAGISQLAWRVFFPFLFFLSKPLGRYLWWKLLHYSEIKGVFHFSRVLFCNQAWEVWPRFLSGSLCLTAFSFPTRFKLLVKRWLKSCLPGIHLIFGYYYFIFIIIISFFFFLLKYVSTLESIWCSACYKLQQNFLNHHYSAVA